jgi:hypothetical protein
VPAVTQVAQLFKIRSQIMQFGVAAKYWAEAPDDGPDGWGFRAQLTLVFPQ